ncbi:hypothetical protein MG293_015401 [Ovis ammon polii]|uniref:F-box domain-containing protein n=1 Tax=Ovis ammon polii TaxID=230172 RepID=A0AAD4TXF3_OVIAM|nr:hypothetical protein MG293_015401 [Ovis ammon polii]
MWSKMMVCWGGAACRDADSAGALRAPEGTGCLGLWAAAAWPGEDDLGASGGLPARVPARDREPEEVLNLNRQPNELLQEVLSYLPPSTLLRHCRPVCRRWRDVVDGWDLWPSILPWKHPDPWPVIRTCLPPADAPGPCILGRFCERRPIGHNLLRNSQNPRGLDPKPGEAVDVDQLPNELLQEVLRYLPPSTLLRQCRQVCRRWRDVVDGWDLCGASCPGDTPTCGPSSAPACPLLTTLGPASWAASASADP